VPVHEVVPEDMYYGCIVDILGHSGLLEEAIELIEKMPMVPIASV
jgi:pentatricopeptide repeat protein